MTDGRWTWEAVGAEASSSPGAMIRGYQESGEVESDDVGGAGEALVWVLDHGPMWGVIDSSREVTIVVRPPGWETER